MRSALVTEADSIEHTKELAEIIPMQNILISEMQHRWFAFVFSVVGARKSWVKALLCKNYIILYIMSYKVYMFIHTL